MVLSLKTITQYKNAFIYCVDISFFVKAKQDCSIWLKISFFSLFFLVFFVFCFSGTCLVLNFRMFEHEMGVPQFLCFKACVCYFFIIFLFFHQMIALQKLRKVFFISSKKLFLYSRYSNFCNFFPSFPHFPDSKGQMEVEQFMMSWIGLHKLVGVVFGITQKQLYITPSNFVR